MERLYPLGSSDLVLHRKLGKEEQSKNFKKLLLLFFIIIIIT